ncbi:hypothetical protein PG995_005024 [Apiospora arundinis]
MSFTFTLPQDGRSDSSDGILTPRSGSTLPTSIEGRETRGSHGRPRILSGNILPSIEPIEEGIARSRSSETASTHVRTPSVSLTPPTSSDSSHGRVRVSPRLRSVRDDDDLGSIDARLQNLNIDRHTSKPMAMSELVDALNSISSEANSQTPRLLTPEAQRSTDGTPLPRRARRRRSSSKVSPEFYDVRDEKAPNDRFNEPTFQSAFRDARTLMSDLRHTLASSSLHIEPDSAMKRLHLEAEELSNFHCPPSRTVGFVGDSGVGKSSLLNSLLDFRGLARASNGGAACTCVATEYHFHGRDDFVVRVHRFTEDEIKDQLANLLQAYRNFHLNESTLQGDEREHYEQMANVAKHTFAVMFGNRFRRNRSNITRVTEAEGLEMLYDWLDEVSPSFDDASHTTPNIEDCSNLLAQLTSEQMQARSPAEWPYIKKISVYLQAQILSKGLVLVDLPGLRDLNAARRHITERYLLECDEIFAVCIAGRAITDEGVMNVIELAKKAKLSHVGIVCTKSDDIKSEEAIKDWKGEKARMIRQKSDAAEAARQTIRDITKELEDYGDTDDDMSDGEKDEQLRLMREQKRAKTKYADLRFESKRYLMTCRNEITKSKLRKNYQNKVPSRTLEVFCVSNTEYWDNRNEPKAYSLRHLQLSGILAVREHCMEMVSESQRRLAEHYIKHSIPALVRDVDLWVQSGLGTMTAERKQDVREALNTLEGRLKRDLWGPSSAINGISSSNRNLFKAQILLPSRDRFALWSRQATEASFDWSGWHHSTYSAFCRNYGNHRTPAVGSRDWNQEAIEAMVEDLTPLCLQFYLNVGESHEELISKVQEVMSWATDYLDNGLDGSSASMSALSEAIETRQCLLERDMENVCEESTKAMEYGKRLPSKRHHQQRGEAGHLVQRPDEPVQGEFAKIADKLQEDLQSTVKLHLESVRVTLDMVRSENVALESERDPEYRARVQARVEMANEEIKRVHELVGI